MSHEQQIEQMIQERGLTAPRLSPADLDAAIAHTEIVKHVSHSGQVLRWAILTLHNGFSVTGRPSVSVSPANDNPEVGERVAIDNTRNELWPLLGILLRERLYQQAQQAARRPDPANGAPRPVGIRFYG